MATATGLTVRALHHYDEVGLLMPTLRSSAGAPPVPGALQVELEQRDVAAVVEQYGAHGAALAVDAHVLVVQAQAQVLDVQAAHLAGRAPQT